MAALETRTFVSGNSVALRLPKALGIGPDVAMRIERRGNVLTVVPVHDPAEERRKVLELVEALDALPKPDTPEVREPFEFPDRPGL